MMNRTPAKKHWEKLGSGAHHGINVFLPALRSRHTVSIGEYRDLIPIIDWCDSLGLDIIQILPLNDSGLDKSPYNGISAFALNPVYLSLPEASSPTQRSLLQELKKLKRGMYFNYIKNYELKHRYLRLHFDQLKRGKEELHEFIAETPWLLDYSYFKTLKMDREWSSWQNWKEKPCRVTSIDEVPHRYRRDVLFNCYLQYLCYRQMREVRKHAETKEVLIKGDIPILISPESADVWLNQEMFQLRYSCGAPPDHYSPSGQYWGFPTYNWQEQEKKILQWWKDRLQYAENFYHLYRIDHVVGLFRMWSIPRGEHSLNGQFIPSKRKEWMAQGKRILQYFLKYSTMLPIAEDLGLVPNEIKECIRKMGIPGTKVMRWEKTDPEKYPKVSMTTLSTHDSETLINWWKNYPDEARPLADQLGWHYRAKLSQKQVKQLIELSHHSNSIFHINLLQEYFPLIPGFLWNSPRGERINVPGTEGIRNWRYRYRPSVEQITSNITLASLFSKGVE